MTDERKDSKDPDWLADDLAALRAAKPVPSPAFLDRLMVDALDQMPVPDPARPTSDVWTTLLDVLGGWRGGAALAASILAGLWAGYAAPDDLLTISQLLSGLTEEEAGTYADFLDLALQEG